MSDKVYLAGLDLGRPHEFTALSVLERTEIPDPDNAERRVRHYAVRHLERLPPATPYPEVFARLTEVFADSPLRGSKLVVDYTGVGRPVLDMLRKAKVGSCIDRLVPSRTRTTASRRFSRDCSHRGSNLP